MLGDGGELGGALAHAAAAGSGVRQWRSHSEELDQLPAYTVND